MMNLDEEKIGQLLKIGCENKINSEVKLRELVILPLLGAMGWNFDEGDYQLEKKIQISSKVYRIDCVVGKGNKKFIIEAKTPDSNLNNAEYIDELLSYMKQEGINYGFLFNGKELLAFKKDNKQPFYSWDCKDKDLEIFRMFSKDEFPNSINGYIKNN